MRSPRVSRALVAAAATVVVLAPTAAWADNLDIQTAPSSDKSNESVIKDQIIQFKDVPTLIKDPPFVSVKYNNADVREVLRYIAKQAGMNMMLDDSVQGRFTFEVQAMPLDELFGLVLRMNSLAARRIGTSILIAKDDQIAKKVDDTQAATIRLNNADAATVVGLLKGVGSKDLVVTPDPRTNLLLVIGSAEDIAKVKNAVKALDVPAPQVLIEVKVVEVNTSIEHQLGGEFGFAGSKFGVANGVTNATDIGSPAGVPASTGTAITFSALGNVTSSFNARINALINSSLAKVLASPRVATQDSKQATIKIVNKVPTISTTFTGAAAGGAAVATEQVQFQEIGETLTITPRIDTNGYVTMDLQPTVSVQDGQVVVSGNPVPIINERSVQTRMRVADGETVVIGGLISHDQQKANQKMPLLGDIPLLGWFFKANDEKYNEDEILIMVTPHITTEKAPTT